MKNITETVEQIESIVEAFTKAFDLKESDEYKQWRSDMDELKNQLEMKTKHKLEGYCIRGGEDIADRIRKVFEADGADCSGWSNNSLSNDQKWWADYSQTKLNLYCHDEVEKKEITIDVAERIVYGQDELEKTFPRMMEVSDDGNAWFEREILAKVDGAILPYIANSLNYKQTYGWKHAREIQSKYDTETITVKELLGLIDDDALIQIFGHESGQFVDNGEFFKFDNLFDLIQHLTETKK